MQKHLQKILFTSIVTVALTCTFLPVGKATVINTDKVVAELWHPHGDLRLVAAHRGLRGSENPLAPENSIRAVEDAADHGIEMAEVDLKEMKDGTVILMHDFNLGRTTNIGYYCDAITPRSVSVTCYSIPTTTVVLIRQ